MIMKKKVLIVEDEFIVANNLQQVLENAGYAVAGITSSAEEAAAHLQQQRPDIVLLDIRLQGERSGIDIGRQLKAENIAFIYLSAYSNQAILEEAKLTDPYGFLVKPFRKKDLLVMLDIAWYRHTNREESANSLQQELLGITRKGLQGQQLLLKTGTLLQSHIPFDLVTIGNMRLLRIGFNEYQFIGDRELQTISHVKTLPADIRSLLMQTFNLESYIESHSFAFYSRQPEAYIPVHTTMLGNLATALTAVAEKITVEIPGTKAVNTTPPVFTDIIGNHHLLISALDLAAQVAPYNTSVLILGESGTGKEKVAQSIHTLSPRKKGPFIKVNCAAIPATLIESELFGHERGAFTGATDKRKGKFEQAEGGTIFLDEIGELPLDMQVKILRVLQEKEIEYIGGEAPVKVDIRILAATNRNLEKEVAAGKFRLDLYYRLNVFPIILPPLRRRKSDIESLATYFGMRCANEFKKPFTGISPAMMEELQGYHWPGNIRELENVIAQSVILNDGKSLLEMKRSLTASNTPSLETLEDVKNIQRETEKEYLVSILKKTNGRIRGVNGAAEILNMKPTTLESKLDRLGIRKDDFR
jgi:DNA-binding NtrC family response regulator